MEPCDNDRPLLDFFVEVPTPGLTCVYFSDACSGPAPKRSPSRPYFPNHPWNRPIEQPCSISEPEYRIRKANELARNRANAGVGVLTALSGVSRRGW